MEREPMTRAPRWFHFGPRRRDERGVTLVELMISVVILSMVTGGIASAFVTALSGNGPTTQRVHESNDAQLVSAYLTRDAQAAGGSDPITGAVNEDLGVSIVSDDGCDTGAGSLIFSFKWVDRAPGSAREYVANYFRDGERLFRTFCVDGAQGPGAARALDLAGNVDSVATTCTPSCPSPPGRGMPETVSLTITATNDPKNAPQNFSYTVTASLRPDAQGAPGGTTANEMPMLVLGSSSCGALGTATGFKIVDSKNVRVRGDLAINADDERTSGACRAMFAQGAAEIRAANIWLKDPSTCVRADNAVCGATNKYYGSIADPLVETTPDSACQGGEPNPSPTGTPPHYEAAHSIFHEPLTITDEVAFEPGIYLFCKGVIVSGPGARVTMLGNDPNAKVTWYAPQGSVAISGGASVNVSRLIAQTVGVEGETSSLDVGTKPPVPLEIDAPNAENLPGWTVNRPYPPVTLHAKGGVEPYAWSASGLPTGLTLDRSSGVISGTPTESGSFTVIVQVFDSAGGDADRTYGLMIGAHPSIATGTLPDWTEGRDYPGTQMEGRDGTTPYHWRADGLPPGLQMSDAGLITGNPTTPGTYTVNVTMVDTADVSTARQYTVKINPKPVIIGPLSLPAWTAGVAYPLTQIITNGGGTAPLRWVASGLPSGLTLDPNTGQLSGTATVRGVFQVKVTIEDGAGASFTYEYPITINRPVGILTPELADGEVSAPYNQEVLPSGGTPPYDWSQTGLPPGLGLNPLRGNTTRVVGTPTTAGQFGPRITIRDTTGAQSFRDYSLTIIERPTIAAPDDLQDWTVNRNFPGTQIVVRDGTAPFAWSATGLPPGMIINNETGVITGEPTAAGNFNVVVNARDAKGITATKTYTLRINPAPVITTNSLPGGQEGIAYNASLAVAQGTPPYYWAASGLPAGIDIDRATGALTGTPTTSGTFAVQFTATDKAGAAATKQLTLVIAPEPKIGADPPPDWTVNEPYPNTTLQATGGTPPFTWTAQGLPDGLEIDPGTGTISGTPTTAGTFNVTATATDARGAPATQTFTVVINGPPSVTTTSLPDGQAGAAYGATLAGTGGTAPLSWSATGMPAGLAIAPGTGAISGTPADPGTFSVNVTATDDAGATATRMLSLVVGPGALSVTGTSPNALKQGATAQDVSVTGTGFMSGGSLAVLFEGPGIQVNSVTFVSATLITANVTVLPTATTGPRDVTVNNGDGNSATATDAFTVNPIGPS
jgi:type II secretory pathway pseudopilin PulG